MSSARLSKGDLPEMVKDRRSRLQASHPVIYGVDIGSRRVAVAGPDYLRAALVLPPPPTGTYRVRTRDEVHVIAGFVAAVVPAGATIWIEQPVAKHGRAANIGTAVRLGMTAGAIFGVHAGPGYIVDQAHWKVEILGNGNASKDQIARWLWAESPADAEACNGDGDLIDATCIRRYGLLVADSGLA